MVRHDFAAEAVELSRAYPTLSIGLHLDLGEWHLRKNHWLALYEVVPLDDYRAVQGEVVRQLAMFRELVGRNPTHIDSHQHVHLREPVRSITAVCAHDLRVPLRRSDPNIRYCGDFYGQDATGSPLHDRISVHALIRILDGLPPGVTELSCHPAASEDLDTMYSAERRQEVEVLCDPRIRKAIMTKGIKLCSFQEAIR
jgi:predicted glycoside hydrolase/deacetylase ChbG (UPF0249 family)